MIIILKQNTQESDIDALLNAIKARGLQAQPIANEGSNMLGLAGDLTGISEDDFMRNPAVDKIVRVKEAYKLAGRKFHPEDSVFDICGRKIGGGHFAVIAGPCSVESEEQILSVARDVKAAGAQFLRGGAFKPRTSPYAFTGLGLDGLELLKLARDKTGLPVVTEIMSAEHLAEFEADADVIQIGARNMQNFTLLRQVGALKKPVLLKRGLSSTLDELLLAAEHVMAGGAREIILCERGIRTFETATRNTLDLSAVPVLKQRTHLPVIIDPSHATGYWNLVEPMALAAAACGADGLIIEVHNHPEAALCDGAQSVTPQVFRRIMTRVNKVLDAVAQ
jgi:3-deoxy-7-phosphoheptulonate synthase